MHDPVKMHSSSKESRCILQGLLSPVDSTLKCIYKHFKMRFVLEYFICHVLRVMYVLYDYDGLLDMLLGVASYQIVTILLPMVENGMRLLYGNQDKSPRIMAVRQPVPVPDNTRR